MLYACYAARDTSRLDKDGKPWKSQEWTPTFFVVASSVEEATFRVKGIVGPSIMPETISVADVTGDIHK